MSIERAVDFTETRTFSDDWKDLGLSDEAFQALQKTIMSRPEGHPVIPGTGGLRKARFAPPGWAKGKRGALRVCYAYFPDFDLVYLFTIYSKSESDDLPAGHKRAYREHLRRFENELRKQEKPPEAFSS